MNHIQKTAADLIKESEKKFKQTGIKQVTKGTGKQDRDNKNNNNNQNNNQ